MTPPRGDWMRRAVLRDPFWVSPSEAQKLTDRELWEDYICPQLEKQMHESDGRTSLPTGSRSPIREDDPPGTLRDEFGRIVTPEEFLTRLARSGIANREEIAVALEKKKMADGGVGCG